MDFTPPCSIDPELFYPPEREGAKEKALRQTAALQICHHCPIRLKCYVLGERGNEECGIWGGMVFDRGHTYQVAS